MRVESDSELIFVLVPLVGILMDRIEELIDLGFEEVDLLFEIGVGLGFE